MKSAVEMQSQTFEVNFSVQLIVFSLTSIAFVLYVNIEKPFRAEGSFLVRRFHLGK